MKADDALDRLLSGNRRYAGGHAERPHQTGERRSEVTAGQQPFAAVLGCSDSRVPPEVILDQGIGDLFVVRTAGHVVDDAALGSLEYAVEHLGVELILVLAHTDCGAVAATVRGGSVDGHVSRVVDAILPAVDRARGQDGDLRHAAVICNAEMVAQILSDSEPVLARHVAEGRLAVVPALYDLATGRVSVIA